MSETDKVISFVIPNYNGKDFIKVCLDSIARQTYTSFETIVVDDASTDDSIDYIKSAYKGIKIIGLSKNSGFCSAVNAGIKASNGNYIALVNNDIELDKEWLTYMMQAAKENADVFSISSKVINYYDRTIIDDAGDIYTREGRAFKRWNGISKSKVNTGDKEIFSASGAASLFSRSALSKVGLWDEEFIAYLDDVDIGFRSRLMGYRNYYEPRAVAYHMVSRSYGKRSVFMGSLVLRNNTAVIIKNMPLTLIVRFLPWLIIGHLKIMKYVLSIGGFKAVIKGYFMFLKMLPYLMRTRFSIKVKTTITAVELKKVILKNYDQETGRYTL